MGRSRSRASMQRLCQLGSASFDSGCGGARRCCPSCCSDVILSTLMNESFLGAMAACTVISAGRGAPSPRSGNNMSDHSHTQLAFGMRGTAAALLPKARKHAAQQRSSVTIDALAEMAARIQVINKCRSLRTMRTATAPVTSSNVQKMPTPSHFSPFTRCGGPHCTGLHAQRSPMASDAHCLHVLALHRFRSALGGNKYDAEIKCVRCSI